MSDLIWEQRSSATDADEPTDSVAGLQRDLAALSRVLLDIPQQSGARALAIAVPELPDVTPWEGAFSTSPGEAMRAIDLLDPYDVEPLPIAEPFVLEETYDVAQPLALAETYEAFQTFEALEPLELLEPAVPETTDFAAEMMLLDPAPTFGLEPLALVEPLLEVPPLVEVEPLVAVEPAPTYPAVEPAPTYPSIVPPAPAVSSWDQLGAPAVVVPEPEPVLPPKLEGKRAANVLAELGFLDD
jgi:hypothetical protein